MKIRKILCILIALAVVATILPVVSIAKTYDTVTLGSYPQSIVTNADILAELNSTAVEWTSYGYYCGEGLMNGTPTASDFMQFTDVQLSTGNYRGVKFTAYRPVSCYNACTTSNSIQQANGYNLNTVYWFKYESIEWIILDKESGLCTSSIVLDSQAYANAGQFYFSPVMGFFADESCEHQSNDYTISTIRTWLNNDFYNTAFSTEEINKINCNTISNNCTTTSYSFGDTQDNVFLLSYDEIHSTIFDSTSDYCTNASDYAACQGLQLTEGMQSKAVASRTGSSDRNIYAPVSEGTVEYFETSNCSIGIRPAVYLDLSSAAACEHHYVSTVTPASCSASGKTVYTCSECGDTYEEVISQLPHTPVTDKAVPADCKNTGLTEGSHCSVCGTIIKEQEVLPKGVHVPVDIPAVDAGCTTPGSKDGIKCSVCDEIILSPTSIPAKGHIAGNYENEIITVATCTTEGRLDMVRYCSVCREELSREMITLVKTSHSYGDFLSDNNASCSKDGTKTRTCSVCSATDTITDVDSAKGHTAGDAVVENETPSTCTASGSYDSVIKCSVCGEELSRTNIETEKKAHTTELIPAVSATCTNTGLTEGSRCSVCEIIIKEQETVDKLSHTEDKAVVENEIPSSCTASGSYDSVIKCSVCREELSRTNIETEKKAHVTEIIPAVVATCTKTGLTEGTRCSVCETIIKEQETVDKLSHKAGEAIIENEIPSSCTASGSYDSVIKCSECGEEISRTNIETEKKAHTTEVIPSVSATCTNTGFTEGIRCSVCGTTIKEQETVDKLSHKAGEAIVENEIPSSCTKSGSYDSVIKCSVCGEEISRTNIVIEKKAHTAEIIPAVAASCRKTGLTEGSRCSYCGVVITEQTIVPTKTHSDIDCNGICDVCCADSRNENQRNCNHLCHKTGFGGFIWKMVNIWNKLLKRNQFCSCGLRHW